jgi:soluble lytic murein transglycosylase-like protein
MQSGPRTIKPRAHAAISRSRSRVSRRTTLWMLAAAVALLAPLNGRVALGQTQASGGNSHPNIYQAVAALYGLDPSLLKAIAAVESHGDAFAVSPKGAAGLMQLMPETAREFQVQNRFDAIDSLLGAARFLRWLGDRGRSERGFGAYLPDIIAAYNAGPQAVARYKGVPPYPETRRYVRRVLLAYLLSPPLRVAGYGRLSVRESAPRACRGNCDQHWLTELERIKTLRRRASLR